MVEQVSFDRLSTAAVPAAERIEFWENSISSRWQRMQVLGRQSEFRAEFVNIRAGETTIASGVLDSVRAQVTAAQARQRNPDSLLLALQGSGRLTVDARGERHDYPNRTLLVRSVDEATTHIYSGRTPMILLSVDAAELSIPMAALRAVMFRPLHLDSALCAMVADAARAVQRTSLGLDGPGMDAYLRGLVELLLRTVSGRQPDHAGTVAVRRQQARDVIRSGIDNPATSTATVADALGISVRRLQQIFAADVSVAQQIRDRRVERAQQLLRDPCARDESIASVAARCGFRDQAAFSRAFRHATGMSPRECRD